MRFIYSLVHLYTVILNEHECSFSQRSSEKPQSHHGYWVISTESGGGMQAHFTIQAPGSGATALLPAEPQVTHRYDGSQVVSFFFSLSTSGLVLLVVV